AAPRAAGLRAESQVVGQFELQVLYRFLDAGNTEAGRTLGDPASKKRRCTKSRDAGQRLGGEHYGDFSLALRLMEADPGAT
ncbi:MAG TPA: hypothetical protein VMS87_06675, partial [Roseiarcus sp.]|nr:hypothetical protein [Roseiarcus sp.]